MTSPVEIVRQKVYDILADQQTGINPVFVSELVSRGLSVPSPGFGGSASAPFLFTPTSENVFQTRFDVDTLGRYSALQYPCLIISGNSAVQSYDRERIFGSKFFGDVSVDIYGYLAWSTSTSQPLISMEQSIDALESALLQTLNRDSTAWQPILYNNRADIRDRIKITITNEGELLRCGIRVAVTARYIIF